MSNWLDRLGYDRFVDIWELRHRIYRGVAETGSMPGRDQIIEWVGDSDLAGRRLAEMQERHLLVLDENGEVQMALPFAAGDSGHRVRSGERSWWANCAWDSLALPILLGVDAEIEAHWLDTGEAVDLEVRNGRLDRTEGFVHYGVPAHRWWHDIVET